MVTESSFQAPDLIANAVEPFSRGFGIDQQTATLMLLQISGAIAGGSIRTVSPDFVECTPGFDLAAIHDGRPMFHGAVIAAIDGVREEIEEAMKRQSNSDRRKLISERERLKQNNADLNQVIETKEKRIVEIRSGAGNVKANGSGGSTTWAPLSHEIQKLESELPELRQKQEDVQRQLADLVIVLHPGVIRTRNDWRDFVKDGIFSLDRSFLQIATAESLLAEASSTSNQLRACAELLQRSRSESTITGFCADDGFRACVNLQGSEEEFAALFRHRRLNDLGFLKSFLFCENTCESAPDPDALGKFMEGKWHSLMAQWLRLRTTGIRTRLQLDRAGWGIYISFREWVWQINSSLPLNHRIFFMRWPELAVRLATTLAMAEGVMNDGVLEPRFLSSAIALLQDCAERQASTLGHLMRNRNDGRRLDEQVEKLVNRLREKGPQTLRQLVRSYSGQSYSVVDGRLFEAIRQGRIVQKGKLYCLPDGNGNASIAPEATGIDQGVAA